MEHSRIVASMEETVIMARVTRSGEAVKNDSAAPPWPATALFDVGATWVAEIAFRACSESAGPIAGLGIQRW